MAEVRLAPRADADLATIWSYSEQLHGEEAATKYLRGFNDSFAKLSEFPEIGPVIDGIRPGTRNLGHRQHRILYRFDGHIVTIVRILHKAQNVQAFADPS